MSNWCVYVIVTPSDGPSTFFKIGRTMRIESRVKGVQTGCPFPIEHVLHLPLATDMQAIAIEGRLHARFSAFHSSGEWFRFDLTNPAHKIEFRAGCHEVIHPLLGDGWRWAMYDVDEVLAVGSKASASVRAKRLEELRAQAAEADQRRASGLAPKWWAK